MGGSVDSRAGQGRHPGPQIIPWAIVAFSAGYFAMALACLRLWGTPSPWDRLDMFSGGFLGLLILGAVVDFGFGFGRTAFRSKDTLREASGLVYDAVTIRIGLIVSVGDALMFLDYGHWHLAPALERWSLQSLGLGLECMAAAWLLWADARLAAHFASPASTRAVIEDGPYRYVRHPRYTGVLGTRVAFALVLASTVGWALALVWGALLLRRIALEERHLRTMFGPAYDAYARRTARLIPGVY